MGSTPQENLRYPVHQMKKTERNRLLDYRPLGQVAGGIATMLRRIHAWGSCGGLRILNAGPRRMTALKIQNGHEARRSGHEMSCKPHLQTRAMMMTCKWMKMMKK